LSGGDSCWFYEGKYRLKKPVRGDLNTIIIMIIIISPKSWYRESICKKGKKRQSPVTKRSDILGRDD